MQENSTKVCPKCNGTMEKSWLLDSHGGVQKAIDSKPGILNQYFVGDKVQSYICQGCGYIESYLEE